MKARQIKKLAFWSSRGDVGPCGGYMEVDRLVVRKVRAVRFEDGLRWQLVKDDHYMWSYCNDVDQECLNDLCYQENVAYMI